MDALYPYSQAASVAALLLALTLAAAGLRETDAPRRRRRFHGVSTAADLSLVLIILSVCVHLVFGHRPGTPDEMALVTFFRAHRGFLVVPVAAALLGQWGRRGTARAPT